MESRTTPVGTALPAWPLVVGLGAVTGLLVLLFLPFGSSGAGRAAIAGLACLCAGSFVAGLVGHRTLNRVLVDEAQGLRRELGEGRDTVRARDAEIQRLQAEQKRQAKLFEAERVEIEQRNQQQSAELEAARLGLANLNAALGELRTEKDALATEKADAIQRRHSLQVQFQDLEASSRQLGVSHAERTAQYKEALAATESAREELHRLRLAEASLSAESQKLRHQVDRLESDRRAAELRERQIGTDLDLLRQRLKDSEAALETANARRGLQEELALRRAELDRLADELAHQREQNHRAMERAQAAEKARESAERQIGILEEQARSAQSVIVGLEDELRNVSKEDRSDMAQHFSWQLNFFDPKEVKLNFANNGATVDVVDLMTEPGARCEYEGERRIATGGQATVMVRPAKAGSLPDDLLLTIRYTLRTQEARFRIRPEGNPKIERV